MTIRAIILGGTFLYLAPIFAQENTDVIVMKNGDPLTDYEPEACQASGGTTGVGDTVATFFVTPAHTGMVVWGCWIVFAHAHRD